MRALRHIYGLRGIRADAVGLLEEGAAPCGERHPPPVAGKERHIELVFETADFPAETRLCHPKPRSSACEAQLFRDRNEEPEMAVFHARRPLMRMTSKSYGKEVLDASTARSYDQPHGGRRPASCDASPGKD